MPKRLAMAALLLLMAAACEPSYFKMTDPVTGREYYTLDYARKDGAVEFKDARTGEKTSLKNPQVLEINQRTFEAGVAATPASSR